MSSPTATTQLIRDDLRNLGLSYDLFTRTTTQNHHRVTRDVFRTLYEKGFIFEQTTVGAFSAATGRTLPDRYIEGTCPICGFPDARGDQCDNCGNQLDPADLIDPRSKIDGTPPVFKRDDPPLPRPAGVQGAADRLDRRAGALAPERPPLLARAASSDLKPRPVTRDLDWGVRVPVPGYEERRRQADLRLDRRRRSATSRRRSSGRATAAPRTPGATGGRTRTHATSTSWARTTSSSTASSGRRSCSATARAASSARAGARSSFRTTSSATSS